MDNFLYFILIHALGVWSPGPGFLLVAENSLVYNKKIAILSSLVIQISYIIQIVLIINGLGAIIKNNHYIEFIINVFGGLFLLYFAFKAYKNNNFQKLTKNYDKLELKKSQISQILITAFLIGITNTKGFTNYLMYLTTFPAKGYEIYYGAWIPFACFCYHMIMINIINSEKIKNALIRNSRLIAKLLCCSLVLFALKVLNLARINLINIISSFN
jgi:threonine/homoserine/homoserine lactone efflux protein